MKGACNPDKHISPSTLTLMQVHALQYFQHLTAMQVHSSDTPCAHAAVQCGEAGTTMCHAPAAMRRCTPRHC